jgi:hypothetical protein
MTGSTTGTSFDRAAPFVVGATADKSRAPLYVLARSSDVWERRTAIVATDYFIRRNDLDDTFALADVLADGPARPVQKAVGGWSGKPQARPRRYGHSWTSRGTMARVRPALRHRAS